jgi:RNase P subunit RPR2
MRTVNISAFIDTIKCSKCNNVALYDDTPYHLIEKPEHLVFEIACPKCGKRDIYSQKFEKIN